MLVEFVLDLAYLERGSADEEVSSSWERALLRLRELSHIFAIRFWSACEMIDSLNHMLQFIIK